MKCLVGSLVSKQGHSIHLQNEDLYSTILETVNQNNFMQFRSVDWRSLRL